LIRRVGVVGCGQMGAGIAEVCARSGYAVVVVEVGGAQLEAGLARIAASLEKAVARGKLSDGERAAARARIDGTTRLDDLGDCDLIIEAVPEVMALKRDVFARLGDVAPAHAVLTSNTSCLAVAELAMAARRPQQVLGMHFMQPAPVRPLLELVTTLLTAPETLATARAFGESLGKTVVVSQDAPGFIVNRLMLPSLLQAVELWERGIASRDEIDTAAQLGLGHPLGPLALLDLIGLDTAVMIADAIYAETRDARFVAPAILRRMVTAGHLGRKAGIGFYEYTDARQP
jgi:3-hydroxybutyryl-CoA dehydrogenase